MVVFILIVGLSFDKPGDILFIKEEKI